MSLVKQSLVLAASLFVAFVWFRMDFGRGNVEKEKTDDRAVFFFDIDNCLYSTNLRIYRLMHDLIDKYMQSHLSLSPADAAHLHASYSKDYGLAIKGLVQHHKIDPLDFNRQVDDALPLDELILPNPSLRKLLLDIDRTKVKLFLFTNAHVTHGMRVVKLLGIDDLFEGITYCDYGAQELLCKPDVRAYEKAEREAGVKGVENVYFVARGWTTAHLVDPTDERTYDKPASKYQIGRLDELRNVFPQLFLPRKERH